MRFENQSYVLKLRTGMACLQALRTHCLTVYRRELSCGSLLLIIGVRFGTIFMSVNIAERPTFEKELFTLINVCSKM